MTLPRQVEGYGDVVVSPHVLATQAGMEILAQGGNAVDAALAANAVLGVVAPETCGIGGDLFALVHRPGDPAPFALNASGRAGSGSNPDRLRAEGAEEIPPFSHHSVTVPGCVSGWQALLQRFGRLDFAAVLVPALRLAETGFPVSVELARALAQRGDLLARQPGMRELFPDGSPPPPGVPVRRPLLAAVLSAIARQGADGFYLGAAGASVVEASQGLITQDDLSKQHADWVEPLGTEVFGLEAWTVPPNSQGYLVLAAARILEEFGHALGDSATALHLEIEAFRAAAADRDLLVADPDHLPLPASELLSPKRLAARAAALDPDRVTAQPVGSSKGGTAYLCCMDSDGVGVSLIQSNYMGLGSNVATSTGFILQNRGAGFTLQPGHPNLLAPGKRPFHTLSPTLWTRQGVLAGLLGTRGGHQQPQYVLRLARLLFSAGASPANAQDAPRWADATDAAHPHRVKLEARVGEQTVAELQRRGHEVVVAAAYEPGWGPASVLTVSPSGLRTGAADPRTSTTSAAVRG